MVGAQINPLLEKLHTLLRQHNIEALLEENRSQIKEIIEALLKEKNMPVNIEADRLEEGRYADDIVDAKVDGQTALHVAARKGNADVVEVLMKSGRADILARDQDGNTPLHLAARSGHAAVVEKLLQQPAATSALMLEEGQGDAAVIRQVCVFSRNSHLRTPLHEAAGSRNPKVVALFLDVREHEDLKEMRDATGSLPFHIAAGNGDVESMEKLAPSDVNVEDSKHFTALHCAVLSKNVKAVEYLLEKGATIKEKTPTPLHLAANSNEASAAEAIVTKFPESWKMKNDEGELAISLAHRENHGDVIRAVLQALQNWKPKPSDDILTPIDETSGVTLLHYAAAHGTKENVEWLANAQQQKAKSVDVVDKMSGTPLHWAATNANKSALKALVDRGANPIHTFGGCAYKTPLFLALDKKHIHIAKELFQCDKERLATGSSRKCLSTEEWMHGVQQWFMAYYDAADKNSLKDELERVLRHREDVYQEISPVYLALHAGELDIAKFFQWLDSDAVNKKGRKVGRTAVHWAVLFQREDIVEQLCLKEPEFTERVRVYEKDAQEMSPVQYAIYGDMRDIESILCKFQAVKDYIADLYRDRQIYVDSTNAILVGAALIASVTFAGWLQPPLGYIDGYYDATLHYAAMRRVRGMRIFWIFNSLSFFAAIATVQAGACGVLPLHHLHIVHAVNYIRRALMLASLLMALSVVCVLVAFGAAGFIVLPPKFQFEFYMMGTVIFGGFINATLICWFLQRILAPRLLQGIKIVGDILRDE